MTADVPVQSGILPIGIVGGLGLQAGFLQVGSQQSVGIECQQIADVGFLVLQEAAVGKPHLTDVECFNALLQRSSQNGQRQEGRRKCER